MRPLEPRKLLTVIAPREFQRFVIEHLAAAGASGYTLTPATGSGSTGLRSGMLAADANVRVEVILPAAQLAAVLEGIAELIASGYRVKAFVADIALLPDRP
jgi:nitrogen regulatory protein PII